MVRATVQKVFLRKYPYDLTAVPGGSRKGTGRFASILFGQVDYPAHIRGIKSFTWSRSVETDVAEATMVLTNTARVGIGEPYPYDWEFERFGYLTPNRGDEASGKAIQRWGDVFGERTGWERRFVPDRIIRTYEGYGSTVVAGGLVSPYDDPLLHPSGVWLLDSVSYTAEGDITLKMRDIGRLLMDQLAFLPTIPLAEYPLRWERKHEATETGRTPQNGSWKRIDHDDNSNLSFVGASLPDDYPAPNSNGVVDGHQASDAFDGNPSTYWLSTAQGRRFDKVWIQGSFATQQVAGVRFKVRGGPYRVYLSVRGPDGNWRGSKRIPYDVAKHGIDVHADIKFLRTFIVDQNDTREVVLPTPVEGNAIRLTFTDLWQRDRPWPWYAAANNIEVYGGNDLAVQSGDVKRTKGNYHDFTDIVKWLCGWAGFYWPPASSGDDYQVLHAGATPEDWRVYFRALDAEHLFPQGSVWGDFMNTGTGGQGDLSEELWDKKPLMDGIGYLRDMTGFNFFIDEMGAPIWRMPNIWKLGNYLQAGDRNPQGRARTKHILTIDENVQLLGMNTTYSSRNIRERLFVASTSGAGKGQDPDGAVVEGYTPLKVGFRRVAGWTDQHFEGELEALVMADMIAARQMFDYRQSQVTIPANPAIQIDDQIRVYERITGDTYYHYVKGITSNLDMDSGEWTYVLDTHWLGEHPSDAWAMDSRILKQATQNYLKTMGAI